MARLFYGVSVSNNGDESKDVVIYNPLEETIEPGDLLAVYFAYGNTVTAPTLVVNGTSSLIGEDSAIPENESVSLSDDAGVFIKTRNVEAEVDYMWQDGEVCLFVLTSQQMNTDIAQNYASPSEPVPSANDTLYYMLVRGARANSEYYGLTKLFTDSFGEGKEYGSFIEWLKADDDDDTKVAATPYLLKQLCQFLIGKIDSIPTPTPTPTPEPDPEHNNTPIVGEGEAGYAILPTTEPEPTPEPDFRLIDYITEVDDSGILIGTLIVGSNEISVRIPQFTGPENTSQLYNDADVVSDGEGGYIHNRKEGQVVISYEPTVDTVVNEDKTYYQKISDDVYQPVIPQAGWVDIVNPDPTANPASNGWYVKIEPGYILTTDTVMQTGKEYWILEEGEEPRMPGYDDYFVKYEPPEEQINSINPRSIPLYEYYSIPILPFTQHYFPTADLVYNPEKEYYYVESNPSTLQFYEYNNEIIRELATETIVLDGKTYCTYVSDNPSENSWYEQINSIDSQAVGVHFITDVVDGNLYLHDPQKTVGLYVTRPSNTIPQSVFGRIDIHPPVEGNLTAVPLLVWNPTLNGNSQSGGVGTTYLNEGCRDSQLKIYGDQIRFNTELGDTLLLDNTASNGLHRHYSTIPFSAPDYIERGEYIRSRYCHALARKVVRLGQGNTSGGTSNYSIWQDGKWVVKGSQKAICAKKGQTTGHQRVNIQTPGYRPIAIVGYNISYSGPDNGYTPHGNSADASYQQLWELYLTGVSGDTAGIVYDTRNYKSGDTYFIIDVYLLCERIFEEDK